MPNTRNEGRTGLPEGNCNTFPNLSYLQRTDNHNNQLLFGANCGLLALLQFLTGGSRMTIPRRSQVSLQDTPYYHSIARCVRRAFLCGEDHYSRRNFDHRRGWLVERLKQQAGIFGVDICACAIMSNHYHVVVRIDRERVMSWSDEEIIERWTLLFSGPLPVKTPDCSLIT
jgi:hypothetical protein